MDINATFWLRYILHASSSYYGWLLYQIWKKSTLSFPSYCNKHIKFMKNIAIIIWHGAIYFYMPQQNTFYLITILKSNTLRLLWGIITKTQNVWKNGHNCLNLAHSQMCLTHSQMLVYNHEQHMDGTWLMYQIGTQSPLLRHIGTNTQNLWKSGHNYSNLAWSHILFYKH